MVRRSWYESISSCRTHRVLASNRAVSFKIIVILEYIYFDD